MDFAWFNNGFLSQSWNLMMMLIRRKAFFYFDFVFCFSLPYDR